MNRSDNDSLINGEEDEGRKESRAKTILLDVLEVAAALLLGLLEWSPLISLCLFGISAGEMHFEQPDLRMSYLLAFFLLAILMILWTKCDPFSKCCADMPFGLLRLMIPLVFTGTFLFSQKHFVWAIVLAAISLVLTLLAWIRWKNRTAKLAARKAERLTKKHTARAFVTAFTLLLLIPAIVGFCSPREEKLVPTEDPIAANREKVIEENAGKLGALKNFDTLELQERIDLMQTVADTECAVLGIRPVSVAGDLLAGSIAANYHHADRTVYVDRDNLEKTDAKGMLRTILHEVYHAYQNDAADLVASCPESLRSAPYFAKAREWRENRNNYIPYEVDPGAYAAQAIEADADGYAAERTEYYTFQFIEMAV